MMAARAFGGLDDPEFRRHDTVPTLIDKSVSSSLHGSASSAASVGHPVKIPPTRHFCTYFDSNYAPRGLVLMQSILRFIPTARFYVLCLDEISRRIIIDRVAAATPISLADIEALYPEAAACKSGRTIIEYYFTMTPCLPSYILEKFPEVDMITYLDSDLFFYESPELVFDEIGDASVAIVPHAFSPGREQLVQFGIYNVAWVSWRNDGEGRRCLDDYRRDCIDWCYDRLEGDRFADQKYLDKWPETYRGVHALAGKGMNLALWNIDKYKLRHHAGSIRVDDDPLVFFHFHGTVHVSEDTWDVRIRGAQHNSMDILIEGIYRPYLALVGYCFGVLASIYGLKPRGDRRYGDRIKEMLKQRQEQEEQQKLQQAQPPSLSDVYQVLDQPIPAAPDEAWHSSDVSEWQEAAYTSVLSEMRKGSVRIDLAVAATAVQKTGLERPSLLDIGCGSGYYSEIFDFLLKGTVDYTGIDYSEAMVTLARCRYPQGRFQQADATALPFADNSFDIVFNAASLMHIPDHKAAIAESARVARRFCIFHTVPLLTTRPTTYLRRLLCGRPVLEVVFNQSELMALFTQSNLLPQSAWESHPYNLEPLLGEPTRSLTILCEVA